MYPLKSLPSKLLHITRKTWSFAFILEAFTLECYFLIPERLLCAREVGLAACCWLLRPWKLDQEQKDLLPREASGPRRADVAQPPAEQVEDCLLAEG